MGAGLGEAGPVPPPSPSSPSVEGVRHGPAPPYGRLGLGRGSSGSVRRGGAACSFLRPPLRPS